jgi:16S rRNA (cytidine1402-2'-O)-methyltransferase
MSPENGVLYLVATPIGNLEDITLRALRTLEQADLIAAEDTRHSLKLLNHYGIRKRLVSFHQHNERERAAELVGYLRDGLKVAVISDAGMPGISDPGGWLVRQTVDAGIPVIPIPGASAVITALAASGLEMEAFGFYGFLPRKNREQLAVLRRLADLPGTMVFYEAPHRLSKTLRNLYEVLGDRPAVLARELTKIHEEFVRKNLRELNELAAQSELKGEFTILVAGVEAPTKNHQNSTNFDPDLSDIVDKLLEDIPTTGKSLKEELKKIAKKTGKSTKEIYRVYLQNKSGGKSD